MCVWGRMETKDEASRDTSPNVVSVILVEHFMQRENIYSIINAKVWVVLCGGTKNQTEDIYQLKYLIESYMSNWIEAHVWFLLFFFLVYMSVIPVGEGSAWENHFMPRIANEQPKFKYVASCCIPFSLFFASFKFLSVNNVFMFFVFNLNVWNQAHSCRHYQHLELTFGTYFIFYICHFFVKFVVKVSIRRL